MILSPANQSFNTVSLFAHKVSRCERKIKENLGWSTPFKLGSTRSKEGVEMESTSYVALLPFFVRTYYIYLQPWFIQSSQLFCRKVLFFHDWVKCALFLVRWVMSVKGFLENMSHIATCSFNGKLIYAICYFYWVIYTFIADHAFLFCNLIAKIGTYMRFLGLALQFEEQITGMTTHSRYLNVSCV